MRKVNTNARKESTAESRARIAQQKQRAGKRYADRKKGGAFGDGQRKFPEPLQLDGKEFYVPDGIPGFTKEGEFVLPGEEFWLRDGEDMPIILLPELGLNFFYAHGIADVADPKVLPRHLSNLANDRWKMAKYLCTHDDDALVVDLTAYEPSEKWKGLVLSDEEYFEVAIEQGDDGWVLDLPDTFIHKAEWSGYAFDAKMEAQAYAEAALASAKSCIFCAQNAYDFAQGNRKGAVYLRREYAAVPLVSLHWAIENRSERGSYFFNVDFKNLAQEPLDGEAAIRRGFGWLASTVDKGGRGTYWRTYENYLEYNAKLSCICTNCLNEDGSRKSAARDHVIEVIALRSPLVDADPELLADYKAAVLEGAAREDLEAMETELGIIYGNAQLKERSYFRSVDPDPDTGEIDLTHAGIYQLMTSYLECPVTGEFVVPEPVQVCSTCDKPTPMFAHQTLTLLEKDSGGFFTFNMMPDPETGRIFWSDWSDLPAVQPPEWSMADLMEAALKHLEEGTFGDYLQVTGNRSYVNLPPEGQARLVGAEVAGLSSRHGVRRGEAKGGSRFGRRKDGDSAPAKKTASKSGKSAGSPFSRKK